MLNPVLFTLALRGTAARLATRFPLTPGQRATLVPVTRDGIPDEEEARCALGMILGLLPPSQQAAFQATDDDIFGDLDRAAALALSPSTASVPAPTPKAAAASADPVALSAAHGGIAGQILLLGEELSLFEWQLRKRRLSYSRPGRTGNEVADLAALKSYRAEVSALLRALDKRETPPPPTPTAPAPVSTSAPSGVLSLSERCRLIRAGKTPPPRAAKPKTLTEKCIAARRAKK